MSYGNGLYPACFLGGNEGEWSVVAQREVRGEGLPRVARLTVGPERRPAPPRGFSLFGVAGHARYVTGAEKRPLDAASPKLARAEASLAVLIPIRKSEAWWALPQDERRAIFEERSHHIADSMALLPRVARRLYHSREHGEPFDFVTWFEFAPEHEAAFDALLETLRSREEWRYVEREVELRLVR